MSNCLRIHNPVIALTKAYFDVAGWWDMLSLNAPSPDGTPEAQLRYWFLDGALYDSAYALKLNLEGGRSGVLTWRDLGAVLYLLARYATKPITFSLTLSDESDSYKSKGKAQFKLHDGQVWWVEKGQYVPYGNVPAHELVDWRKWDGSPRSECTCRCMLADLKDGDMVPAFLSHVKYLRKVGLVSREGCPKCGSHNNLSSARGGEESFTIRATDIGTRRV